MRARLRIRFSKTGPWNDCSLSVFKGHARFSTTDRVILRLVCVEGARKLWRPFHNWRVCTFSHGWLWCKLDDFKLVDETYARWELPPPVDETLDVECLAESPRMATIWHQWRGGTGRNT